MKTFQLSRDMLTMSGQFYPKNHIVAMFPSAEAAEAAVRALREGGIDEAEVCLIPPEVMLRDVVRTVGDSGSTLPSAGTEADTVRRYAQFASQGHHTLLIPTPDDDDVEERLMQALRAHQVSHAQKYRGLIIEDLA